VVWETVERLFSQDRSEFMANTDSSVRRETVHPSNECNDGSVNPGLQGSQRSGLTVD